MSHSAQKGQALLIILLVMAVVLTIALSVVSRSVTDITISQKEEEASRAFSAAEAGVEQALLLGEGRVGEIAQVGTFDAKITGLAEGGKTFAIPILLNSGETVPVWFVAHEEDGSLVCNGQNPCFTGNRIRICWGEDGTSPATATTPALELSVLYTATPGDFETSRIARGAYDPNTTRRSSNSFSNQDGSCTVEGKSYAFSKTINLNTDLGIPSGATSRENGLQQARLRLLYNTDRAHPVAVSVDFPGNGLLPGQGTKVESTGEAGEATRKIEVYQLFSDLPPIFDFGVFSGSGGLTK